MIPFFATQSRLAKNPNSLPKALTMPVVWTLGLATFAISWVYNMDLSFIPLFLESGHGISLPDASRLASLLPFSGIAGVIFFGVLATRATWRKHLLSTSCAVVLLGSMALFFGEGTITKAGLLVVGFGLSGWLPVLNTYIMALPSMTPSLMAAFVVLVNMAIYMVSAGFLRGRLDCGTAWPCSPGPNWSRFSSSCGYQQLAEWMYKLQESKHVSAVVETPPS